MPIDLFFKFFSLEHEFSVKLEYASFIYAKLSAYSINYNTVGGHLYSLVNFPFEATVVHIKYLVKLHFVFRRY